MSNETRWFDELRKIYNILNDLAWEHHEMAKVFHQAGNDRHSMWLDTQYVLLSDAADSIDATVAQKIDEDCKEARQASLNVANAALATLGGPLMEPDGSLSKEEETE